MIVESIDKRLQRGLVVIDGTKLLDRGDLLIAVVDSLLQIFEREREGSFKYNRTIHVNTK